MGELKNIWGGKTSTSEKKRFYHHIRIFGLNIYLTTLRMRRRQSRDVSEFGQLSQKKCCVTKRQLYADTFGRCQCCGRQFPYSKIQLHHVLPWWKYPEYDGDIRNSRLLCNDCHRAIHLNPFAAVQEMEEVAKVLGVDLSERYALNVSKC